MNYIREFKADLRLLIENFSVDYDSKEELIVANTDIENRIIPNLYHKWKDKIPLIWNTIPRRIYDENVVNVQTLQVFSPTGFSFLPSLLYYYHWNDMLKEKLLTFLEKDNWEDIDTFFEDFFNFIYIQIIKYKERPLSLWIYECLRFFIFALNKKNFGPHRVTTHIDDDTYIKEISKYKPVYIKNFTEKFYKKQANKLYSHVFISPRIDYQKFNVSIVLTDNLSGKSFNHYPFQILQLEDDTTYYLNFVSFDPKYKNNLLQTSYLFFNFNYLEKDRTYTNFYIPPIIESYDNFKSNKYSNPLQDFIFINENHFINRKNELIKIERNSNFFITIWNMLANSRDFNYNIFPSTDNFLHNKPYVNVLNIPKLDEIFIEITFDRYYRSTNKHVERLKLFLINLFPIGRIYQFCDRFLIKVSLLYKQFEKMTEEFDFLISSFKFTWKMYKNFSESSFPPYTLPPAKFLDITSQKWQFDDIIIDEKDYKMQFKKVFFEEQKEYQKKYRDNPKYLKEVKLLQKRFPDSKIFH